MKTEQDSQGATEIQSSTQVLHEPHSGQQNTSEAPVMDSGSISSSNIERRKVSHEEIELVRNLIERCLQLYMSRDEVVKTLLNRARIEPGFTTLVWLKLEEENADFFKAYYIRVKLMRQIILFNHLLEHQYYLMKQQVPPNVPMAHIQNGIHHMPVNNLPMGYPVLQQPPIPATGQPQIDSMHCSMSSCHAVNGIPAPGNFHPIRINSGNSTVMDGTTGVKTEMDFSSASVASNGYFPFTQSIDSTFIVGMAISEGFQLGPDNGTGNLKESLQLWNSSLSDLPYLEDISWVKNYSGSPFLHSYSDIWPYTPDVQNYKVEGFFVDKVPGTGFRFDEEKY